MIGAPATIPSIERHPGAEARGGRPRALRRTAAEIAGIEAAGRVVAEALGAAAAAVRPGVATASIEQAVAAILERRGAEALLRGIASDGAAAPFPAACCTSVNEQVIHGIPGSRRLVEGDVLSIDCAARLDGWCADAAISVAVGAIDPSRQRLLSTAEAMLAVAVAEIRPGRLWSRVAAAMQAVVESAGCSTVTGWTGHGIGRDLHEWPPVPSTLTEGLLGAEDFTLLPGMVLAIEPVVVLHPPSPRRGRCVRGVGLRVAEDGWTVETRSGSPACHVEHTVAVTPSGARILTGSAAATGPRGRINEWRMRTDAVAEVGTFAAWDPGAAA
jgi:methionyl aminopeptidase